MLASNIDAPTRERLRSVCSLDTAEKVTRQHTAGASGYFLVQRSTGKWQRTWVSYLHGQFSFKPERHDENVAACVQVTHCVVDHPLMNVSPPSTPPRRDGGGKQGGDGGGGGGGGGGGLVARDGELHGADDGVTGLTSSMRNASTASTPTKVAGHSPDTSERPESPSDDDDGGDDAIPAVETPTKAASQRPGDVEFWTYFASLESYQCVALLFTPQRVFVLRAADEKQLESFTSHVRADLRRVQTPAAFSDKDRSVDGLLEFIHDQFMAQVRQYALMRIGMSRIGSGVNTSSCEDNLPITSKRKDKSGVLTINTPADPVDKWRSYYFVLFEGCLFYYKDSKSQTPSGYVSLKFASVYIDRSTLNADTFVFEVRTPLRAMVCMTKHAVALSEWAAVLETTVRQLTGGGVVRATGKEKAERSRASQQLLEEINAIMTDISTLQQLLSHARGFAAFVAFLDGRNNGSRADCTRLSFYSAAQHYRAACDGGTDIAADGIALSTPTTPPPLSTAQLSAEESYRARDRIYTIVETYLDSHAPQPLEGAPTALTEPLLHVARQYSFVPARGAVDDLANWCLEALQPSFRDFQASTAHSAFGQQLTKSLTGEDVRQLLDFDPTSQLVFLLKIKGIKQSVEVKLSRKQNVMTMGRDKSNDMVMDDSRVSRSHARVEYDSSRCEFIDLGSSCGSRLNGKPVLRARLRAGDVLELGQSLLIFEVRKRRRMSLFKPLHRSSIAE
jgi:hypothetical protein